MKVFQRFNYLYIALLMLTTIVIVVWAIVDNLSTNELVIIDKDNIEYQLIIDSEVTNPLLPYNILIADMKVKWVSRTKKIDQKEFIVATTLELRHKVTEINPQHEQAAKDLINVFYTYSTLSKEELKSLIDPKQSVSNQLQDIPELTFWDYRETQNITLNLNQEYQFLIVVYLDLVSLEYIEYLSLANIKITTKITAC